MKGEELQSYCRSQGVGKPIYKMTHLRVLAALPMGMCLDPGGKVSARGEVGTRVGGVVSRGSVCTAVVMATGIDTVYSSRGYRT